MVSAGLGHAVRASRTAEDQADHRAAIPACRGKAGARAAGKGRRHRQVRDRVQRGFGRIGRRVMPPRLPSEVEAVVTTYLTGADQEAPGQLEALYLVGSAALGDFRPHTSDIDFIAVIPDKSDPELAAALARVHERLSARRPRPRFDGMYVTWEDLARDP